MSETPDPIKTLDTRLKAAEVTLVDEEAKLYEVFVPGAVRERTRVKADSEEEAVAKVRENLVTKINHLASKPAPTGGSDGELEVHDSKHKNDAQNVGGEA